MSVFGNLSRYSAKKIQVAANRTILTPAGFPMAHLKADVLRIPKMYKIRWFRGFEQELWLLKVS